eukprot:TRINITY_DN29243_c0_g1_i1.p1 TRINITY_DN29243_c0_g1~~TRINITY_DN29243_c0_g1_i1.p1  ORF type:complete len:237 (-),score=31.69 TRINITY_DN29243_c0_g1_i1:359-1069(-)
MMIQSYAHAGACGSGARAALRLRAFGGGEGANFALSAPAHPSDRVRSAKPEPRPKPGAGESGHLARSGEAEQPVSASDISSTSPVTVDAPKRRSSKPTPRIRRGGSSSSQNLELVVGETKDWAEATSIEETLVGAGNVIGGRDEKDADESCTRMSCGLENVMARDCIQGLNEAAMTIELLEAETFCATMVLHIHLHLAMIALMYSILLKRMLLVLLTMLSRGFLLVPLRTKREGTP